MKLNQQVNHKLKTIALLTAAVLVTACQDEKTTEEEAFVPAKYNAVITTRAADYSAGDHAIAKLSDYSVKTRNFSSGSDTVVSTYKDKIFRLGRYNMNNITQFDIDSPESIIWQFSTDDANVADDNSNPYKMVVSNDQKAYIIRYGSDKIWIVNPSANNITDFRLGEINLSSYADADDKPEMADALIVDTKLYVIIQRLDRNNNFTPGDAYLAIFNTDDDSEIDTNGSTTPKGVMLTVQNPQHIEYLSSNNTLYISAAGQYAASWNNTPAAYTGGIESIKLSDYSSAIVLDDGPADTGLYGNISNAAILNSTRGYFVGYKGFGDNTLYEFNPSDTAVTPTIILDNKDIADIEIGPLGDLWVANATDNGVTLIHTTNNVVRNSLIDTVLTPMNIEFVTHEDL